MTAKTVTYGIWMNRDGSILKPINPDTKLQILNIDPSLVLVHQFEAQDWAEAKKVYQNKQWAIKNYQEYGGDA